MCIFNDVFQKNYNEIVKCGSMFHKKLNDSTAQERLSLTKALGSVLTVITLSKWSQSMVVAVPAKQI